MNAKLFSILVLIIVLPCQSFAQISAENDLNYPKKIIQKLTADEFAGRGYTENGMGMAADFIAAEFEKAGLEKIGDSYFQEFNYPVNVILDAKLKINGKELKYGIDFLVKPSSKSQNFNERELHFINPKEFETAIESEDNLRNFIIQDTKTQTGKHIILPPGNFKNDSVYRYYKDWPNFYSPEENRHRSVFYFTKDKLTASPSTRQDSISEFIVLDKFYSKDLKIDNYKIESRFEESFSAKNVIGRITGENSDSLLVVTAHYDHLGKVGDTLFPGASDNASGTAFLIELARYFSKHKPKYTLIFIAFAGEEAGLFGSSYFVENPIIDLKKIKFLLNFDIMGAGEDGIQIVNSSIFTEEYEFLKKINDRKKLIFQIKKRGEACNSDHCPFYLAGVPSFFIYTLGGPGYYHDPMDTAESLNLNAFLNLKELFIEFIQTLK